MLLEGVGGRLWVLKYTSLGADPEQLYEKDRSCVHVRWCFEENRGKDGESMLMWE